MPSPKAKTAAKASNRTKTKAKAKTAAKSTAKSAPAKMKTTAITEPYTKTAVYNEIAEVTGLSRKEVVAVFDAFTNIIHRHIKKRAAGIFAMLGLLKITVVKKPATKARKGINPFTGEPTVFKAKPAKMVVKIKALKKLKEMVN